MTKVLFILHRTDLKPTAHDYQFLAQTQGETIGNWYSTSELKLARRFGSDLKLMKFLAKSSPSNSFAKFRLSEPTIGCYKVVILDLAEAKSSVVKLRSLPSEAIPTLGPVYYISTLERPSASAEGPTASP